MPRKIVRTVQGHPTMDGAGVKLTRVLGLRTAADFDPFLMLDAFDSTNPSDYTAGFPLHPHRGIETITYLVEGEIQHRDTLGNHGTILSGQSQWMTAGGGIQHEEMPKPAPRLFGLQIWLNLPAREKMTDPAYFDITNDMMGSTADGEAKVRVISGEHKGAKGVKPRHIQASIYDVALPAGRSITMATRPEETVFVYLLAGDAVIDGRETPGRTAVLFGPGDSISVAATAGEGTRFMFFSAPPLREPVAWGGPIVMNTEAELEQAFAELEAGTFVRKGKV